MHFRPRCVCGLFTRFVWEDCAWVVGVVEGGLRMGRLMSFGWIARGMVDFVGGIACKWLFYLCGIAWKNMMEFGRGGAYVPARVAP